MNWQYLKQPKVLSSRYSLVLVLMLVLTTTLSFMVQKARLKQIEEQQYEAGILAQGIDKEHIRKYGFAFEGKKVLIGC